MMSLLLASSGSKHPRQGIHYYLITDTIISCILLVICSEIFVVSTGHHACHVNVLHDRFLIVWFINNSVSSLSSPSSILFSKFFSISDLFQTRNTWNFKKWRNCVHRFLAWSTSEGFTWFINNFHFYFLLRFNLLIQQIAICGIENFIRMFCIG